MKFLMIWNKVEQKKKTYVHMTTVDASCEVTYFGHSMFNGQK